MISVPSADPVGALVPHTLKEPLPAAASGPARRAELHGEGPVRHSRPQGQQRQSRISTRMPRLRTRRRPSSPACSMPAHPAPASPSATSSSTACSAPTPITASRSTRARPNMSPAAHPAARPRRSRLRCATSRSAATRAARSACRRPSRGFMVFVRPSAASTSDGATAMAPSYDTIGFLAREAELSRKIGHVLLEGRASRRISTA